MKKIAFTICAKNYIGLAQTLESSIKKHSEDVEFLIFVADEISSSDGLTNLPENVIISKDVLAIPTQQWHEMAFKYDLTEFCTSIKPSCFKYIFKEFNPDVCIYFDPDILTFNSLDIIFNQLNNYSIMVTPHITTIEENYSGSLNERNLLYSGMFNLGFLGLKNDETANIMLDWWAERLKDRCYQNVMENYFTDQKWMDFLPSFFPDELLISTDLGLNVAPWNFYERQLIVEKDGRLNIKHRFKEDIGRQYPLTFIHFSGFNYKAFLNNELIQGNIKNLELPTDFNVAFSEYATELRKSNISKYIDLTYSYNFFSNLSGVSITYRRLYRRLLEDGKIKTNPFDFKNPFYQALKKSGLINKKMVIVDKTNVANVSDTEAKTIKINKLFKIVFKIIGPERFFLLTRLMRLYSKPENHVYLIDEDYLKKFKIRN
ncbi:hypothetical protein [Pedobacter puniceum]|uniref:Glycosyl transferase n=1 Tax=Pedobacter puniceum TaxID=2666136 RepID=A0A7K0FRM3_9SPHI|nr:hypothetical protein [Pedobacter puniceum]MRX48658.1 hypothetical protein [Pedobacter puniceum]